MIVRAFMLVICLPMLVWNSQLVAEQVQLAIRPAAFPMPAMQYRLVPSVAEQNPANAATLYLSAFAAAGEITADPDFQRLQSAESKAFPEHDARQLVNKYSGVIEQLLLAAHRDHCRWDPPTREQPMTADFAYLSRARVMVDLLRIKARLEIVERRFAQAIETLQSAFALVHDLNQPPSLQAAVAVGLEAALLDDVRELMCRDGCPNLYWALGNLPSADEHRREIIESDSLFVLFPQLKRVENLSAGEARDVLNALSGAIRADQRGEWNVSLTLSMIRIYPEAKKYLMDGGLSAATIEAIPANSAILRYLVADYHRRADELEKWAGMPLGEACIGMERATSELQNVSTESNPLLSVLPRHNELLQVALAERKRAMLQVVEGLRAYASSHYSALPTSLDQISAQTPLPPDPLLGRSFDYSLTGNVATLHAGVPPELSHVAESTLVITLVH